MIKTAAVTARANQILLEAAEQQDKSLLIEAEIMLETNLAYFDSGAIVREESQIYRTYQNFEGEIRVLTQKIKVFRMSENEAKEKQINRKFLYEISNQLDDLYRRLRGIQSEAELDLFKLFDEQVVRLRQYRSGVLVTALLVFFNVTLLAYHFVIQIQMANSLEKSVVKAEKAMSAKSEFLAIMNHEIRTPINAILGMTGLLQKTGLNEQQAEYCETIIESGNQLTGIISDILDFSKLEAHMLKLRPKSVDIMDVLRAVEMTSTYLPDKGVSFEADFSELEGCRVNIDRTRLCQILNNLIINAFKFTEKGTVTLRVKTLSKTEDAAEVYFEVTDTGVGIGEGVQDKIFESFIQVDSSFTREFQGAGLGLSISRKLVSLMNGSLEVKSTPGQGATFFFTLILRISNSVFERKESKLSEIKTDYSREYILIAEDNLLNQKILIKIFESMGVKIKIAENGQEAEDLCKNEQFSMIFMDLHMPKVSGLDAVKQIRKLSNYKQIPILALTADATEEVRQTCLNAGMDGFLTKPISVVKLEEAIAEFRLSEDLLDFKSSS
ncbi:MAG: response regulator [Lentisphaeria bacterium]|nr:response regulator [Lentisphaeria bacterium]